MRKIEIARIRQELIDSITRNSKDLTILISTYGQTIRLSPESKTSKKNDSSGDFTTSHIGDVLHHGFIQQHLKVKEEESCYRWILEMMQKNLGSDIKIIFYGDNISCFLFSTNYIITPKHNVEVFHISIVARSELLIIARDGKVPVMMTKSDISKLPTKWHSVKQTTIL
jgi:hypothetical protein